jgi:hypothetical protein
VFAFIKKKSETSEERDAIPRLAILEAVKNVKWLDE